MRGSLMRASIVPTPALRPWKLPPCRVQVPLQSGQDPHDPQPCRPVGARGLTVADALDEVLALDPQRLAVRDPGAVDVSRPGDVLAVGVRVLVEALVVDGDLAF